MTQYKNRKKNHQSVVQIHGNLLIFSDLNGAIQDRLLIPMFCNVSH